MKVTVVKTFVNENGTSILKGRKIEVSEAVASKLEAEGLIETMKPVTNKKVTKEKVVEDDRPRKSSSKSSKAVG